MKGVVLCGGQSLRMGKDKGLLIGSRKITWAQHAVSLMAQLEIEVVISVNQNQYPSYRRVFFSNKLIKDNKAFHIEGPLLGILSSHLAYPKEDLMVLATDMIEMTAEVLNSLYNAYQQDKNFDAYVFKDNNIAEPLSAIYKATGLAKLIEKHRKNELEKHSLKYALEQLNVMHLPINPEWKKSFSNINTVSDLKSN